MRIAEFRVKLSYWTLLFILSIFLLQCVQTSSSTTTTGKTVPSNQRNIIPVKNPNEILLSFGSCNAFVGDEPNDIFNRIRELHPDVWVWLGDVTYIDVFNLPPRFKYRGEEYARDKFNQAKNNPNYKKLRESTQVIGIWDDHDYGLNNAGKGFPFKNITRKLWLDFIDEPQDSQRRTRNGGIYESYYLGDSTKIKVILIDNRFSREDPWLLNIGANDLLGPEQWEWLENEFKHNEAQYIVIGSGVQVIADDRVLPERWFKQSKDRLVELIRKYKLSGVILLSGDVHFAEIMKYPCNERIGFDLYEFTSSGMTHYTSSHVPLVDNIINAMYPLTYSLPKDRFFERNFGNLIFKFGENSSSVKLEARNYYGVPVLEKELSYSQLTFDETIINNNSTCIVDTPNYQRFLKHYAKGLLHGEKYLYLGTFFVVFGVTLLIFILRSFIKLISWILRKVFGRGSQKSSVKKTKQE